MIQYNLLERSLRWRTKRKRRTFTPEFKAEVVLEALRGESSQAELCRRHNLSEDPLSKWKQQAVENITTGFTSTDKHANEATERIAHLEQLVGKLTLALEIQKKSINLVELTPSQQRYIVDVLRTAYSVRQICEVLGFNKSTLYYQPRIDPSEDVLREEIERLAARYPTYGYRRITKLLLRLGYPRWVSPRGSLDESNKLVGVRQAYLSNDDLH